LTKPKVIVTRKWPAQVEAELKKRFDVTLNESDRPLTKAELSAAMTQYDALCPTVSDQISGDVIGTKNSRVKLVANFGVGFNHIDIAAAKSAGIQVSNTPDVLTDATADLAFSLMLSVARRTSEGERELRRGAWTGWRPTHMMGAQVTGKTLGLVGFGRIAQALAKKAHFGFDMNIVVFNRSTVSSALLAHYGAQQVADLDTLLQVSDFVSLHCPSTPQTRHMIDRDSLQKMKRTAFLINTARGDVIDEAGLVEALAAGVIAGAGLDVFENEPQVPKALIAMENVVLLPHLGSATAETRVAMGQKVVDNLDAFFAGKSLPDAVIS
jgi:lactate dehydrogenase-like 2-hydroxyacid dehydrogenase